MPSDGAGSGARHGTRALAQFPHRPLCRMLMQQELGPGPGLVSAWPGAAWEELSGAQHGTHVSNLQGD